MIALMTAYQQSQDVGRLDGAREIGRWIEEILRDNTSPSDPDHPGFGGYFLGFPEGQLPRQRQPGKSTENNADIFAAFSQLAAIERALGNEAEADLWTERANHAGDFVTRMFDPGPGRFFPGTVPAGSGPGPGIDPCGATEGNDTINCFDFLDSNSFTTLALAASPRYRNQIDWRRPVQYILDHFAKTITANGNPFQGFSLVVTPVPDASRTEPSPDGIAWEFTAQAVVTMRFVDSLYAETTFELRADFYLKQIQRAQPIVRSCPGAAFLPRIEGSWRPFWHCKATLLFPSPFSR